MKAINTCFPDATGVIWAVYLAKVRHIHQVGNSDLKMVMEEGLPSGMDVLTSTLSM